MMSYSLFSEFMLLNFDFKRWENGVSLCPVLRRNVIRLGVPIGSLFSTRS